MTHLRQLIQDFFFFEHKESGQVEDTHARSLPFGLGGRRAPASFPVPVAPSAWML